jgi:putative ABC transport system permease protein
MERRLLFSALGRRRGMVALAVVAVAIGASVTSALLHVSGDVSRKVSRELRSLGPNLLVLPAEIEDGASAGASVEPARYLEEHDLRARLASARIDATPLLYMIARANGQPIQIIGADLDAARRLHPGWKVRSEPTGADSKTSTMLGVRLARRLGVKPGEGIEIELANGARVSELAGASLEAGSADDEALWVPLLEAQKWGELEGRVSLAQARVEGDARAVDAAVRALDGNGMRAVPVRALSATEAVLLERMKRLMALVTAAALISAGLAAFGTLTDLALERRREIALMKALGASRTDVVRQFAAEALAIGLIGGVVGWAFGLMMAEVIGRSVFHSAIAVHWNVPPTVLALSLAIAALASFGPIRLALAVEPARALKGD